MYTENDNDQKLDWMYKNENCVNQEDYLLGKTIDVGVSFSSDNIDGSLLVQPKNHVEHECIPPSIRDYKKQQIIQEQVDLQVKLQDDPLLVIQKREEEARRQFLQNPLQLKKLQKSLKTSSGLPESILNTQLSSSLKTAEENLRVLKERKLDIVLIQKYKMFKHNLNPNDLQKFLNGNSSNDLGDRYTKNKLKRRKVKSEHEELNVNISRAKSGVKVNNIFEKPNVSHSSKTVKRDHKITEKEKEALRKEMLSNGNARDIERASNLKLYNKAMEETAQRPLMFRR